jgi:DNA helicase TIP49 (TBP-interacting protein)
MKVRSSPQRPRRWKSSGKTSSVPFDSGSKVNKTEGEESKVFSMEIKKTEVLTENFRSAIGLRIKGR